MTTVPSRFSRIDQSATADEAVDHLIGVLFGNRDFDQHHGFGDDRRGLPSGIQCCLKTRDPKGLLGRITIVIRAVPQPYPHTLYWMAGDDATGERFPDTLLDRPDELLWYRPALDVVLEDGTGSLIDRIEIELDVSIVAATIDACRSASSPEPRAWSTPLCRQFADGPHWPRH